MTDIHIVSGDLAGEQLAVMHFPVPAGNNPAGTAWSAAITTSRIGLQPDGRRTVLVSGSGTGGTISVAEEAALDAGTLFEVVVPVRLDTMGTNNTQRQAALDLMYPQELARQQAELSARLKYFGFTRDVP